MFDRFQHHRPMISGVCAWMADRSGLPVAFIRIVALVLLMCHALLVTLAYLAGAYALRRAAASHPRGLTTRFEDIDRRLAEAEEAAWRAQYRRGL